MNTFINNIKYIILSLLFLIYSCSDNKNKKTLIFPISSWYYNIVMSDNDIDNNNWYAGSGAIAENYDSLACNNDTLLVKIPFSLENIDSIQQITFHSNLQANYNILVNGIFIKNIKKIPLDSKIEKISDPKEKQNECKKYFIQDIEINPMNYPGIFKNGINFLYFEIFNSNICLKESFPKIQLSVLNKNVQKTPRCNNKNFKSDLPVVIIETDNNEIPDEPKINAHMKILNNDVNDSKSKTFNLDVNIGIEIRGNTSQIYPKKSYGLETRDASGNNLNISILGLPEENDWILYAPYADKTFLRNALAYKIFGEMGHYSVHTRFCELFINNEYSGLYILTEKIKKDINRVNISDIRYEDTSGVNLTGGYIVNHSYDSNRVYWKTKNPDYQNSVNTYSILYPKTKNLHNKQIKYIQDLFNYLERSIYNSESDSGLSDIIDFQSFIDYIIITELSKNIDGYRLNTYYYKDRDNINRKIYAGPIWDYNFSFGLSRHYSGYKTEGWIYEINRAVIPQWWPALIKNDVFHNQLRERWFYLRSNILSETELIKFINTNTNYIRPAICRNFKKWNVMKNNVWPCYFHGKSYDNEINYMKYWLKKRLDWIDENI